jgi:hypothetical protein
MYMALSRKINFTQMGNYSDSCEQRFRMLFGKDFDWLEFNISLANRAFSQTSRKAIAVDASYISKAGKKTPYIGKFWSGCAASMKRGLEILSVGLIDVDTHDCFALRAEQTPNDEGLEKEGYTLTEWYLHILAKNQERYLKLSKYVVADAWFSKSNFVNELTKLKFHLISRLRDDSALWYSHDGVRTGKRGRPRTKGEKIDFKNLDSNRCTKLDVDPKSGEAFEIMAYSKAMKRNIKIVLYRAPSGSHKIYFSTDINMSGKDIVEYYRTRFQIEFVFRDAKQFTGLNHCQARDLKKLDFAFNASLASVNVAKVMRKEYYPNLSIGLLKSYISNVYMLNRILARSGVRPNSRLNTKLVKELFGFVDDAA